MNRRSIARPPGLLCVVVLVLLLVSSADGRAASVDCDQSQTIQATVNNAANGEQIDISGSCIENVLVDNRVSLVASGGTTLAAAESTEATITTCGFNVPSSGFSSITGGLIGMYMRRGGSLLIESKVVRGAPQQGILINEGGYAVISENTVNNIGTDPGTSFRYGIGVVQGSSADFLSNVVTNNGGRGIMISRSSTADIDGITIDDNGSVGLGIFQTSSVKLAGDPGRGGPNGFNRKGGVGLNCASNSSVPVNNNQQVGSGADANAGGTAIISNSCVVVANL